MQALSDQEKIDFIRKKALEGMAEILATYSEEQISKLYIQIVNIEKHGGSEEELILMFLNFYEESLSQKSAE